MKCDLLFERVIVNFLRNVNCCIVKIKHKSVKGLWYYDIYHSKLISRNLFLSY